MALILVTVGTDGLRDWVQTPDGQKFRLGTQSVLSFVVTLAKTASEARACLDQFLKEGEGMLRVDDDKMWPLFAPRRARWASIDGSFMPQDHRMNTLVQYVERAEKVVAHLNSKAASGQTDPKAVEYLQRLACPQPQNSAEFYGLEDTASLDYQANLALAEGILEKTAQTSATIDRLSSEGKRFNSVRAKADVYRIARDVAGLCEAGFFTDSKVRSGLEKLASQADTLHQLFHSSRG